MKNNVVFHCSDYSWQKCDRSTLPLVLLVALGKFFTHLLLEFQHRQVGVTVINRWGGWQRVCQCPPRTPTHWRKSFCQRHWVTRDRSFSTFGRRINSQGCCEFPLCVVVFLIPVVVNLAVLQRQISTVLKSIIQSPVVVFAGAVFLVVDCPGTVVGREQYCGRSCRLTLGFDGGWAFYWGGFGVKYSGLCSKTLLHVVDPGSFTARGLHGAFLTVKHYAVSRFLDKKIQTKRFRISNDAGGLGGFSRSSYY